jgi:predicted dehydrogenase
LPYGGEVALHNLRVIDALFTSEKTGAWVNV